MDSAERKMMRARQIIATNVMLITFIIIYYIVFSMFDMTFSQFFALLGAIMLIQGIYGFIKGDSTSSFIPVFEQVALYEKQKMGDEWFKQRKLSRVWLLVLSGMMFLQSYWNRGAPDNIFQMDINFMFMTALFTFGLINISQFFHIRKVDRALSHQDMKGYTKKSTLIALAAGAAIGVTIVILIISYTAIS